MDNENMGMPSGIGPRLPDPERPTPDKAKKGFALTKRETVLLGAAGVIVVAIIVWFVIFMMTAGQPPKEAVVRAAGDEFAFQEELMMAKLPGSAEKYAYFYISGDQLACAVLGRGASGYKMENVTGHLPLSSTEKPGVWMLTTHRGSQNEFFVFGLLYDKALTTVTVEGEAATVIDNGVYRMWYYYGAGVGSINSESVIYR